MKKDKDTKGELTVADAQSVLESLLHRQDEHHAQVEATKIRKESIAHAALTGDKKAEGELKRLNAQLLEQQNDAEDIESAIRTAGANLAMAKAREEFGNGRAALETIKAVEGDLLANAKRIDKALKEIEAGMTSIRKIRDERLNEWFVDLMSWELVCGNLERMFSAGQLKYKRPELVRGKALASGGLTFAASMQAWIRQGLNFGKSKMARVEFEVEKARRNALATASKPQRKQSYSHV